MATAELNVAHKQDWIFANPWLWLAAGAGLTLWSMLWTLSFGAIASDSRVIVLALGLLLGAVGVWLRWNDRHTVYLLPCSTPLAGVSRLGMGALFALIAVSVTVVLGMSLFGSQQFNPGATILVWLTVVPVSTIAAKRCLQREPKQLLLDANEEVALSLVAAAGIAFAGSWTLFLGDAHTDDWDSIRVFLRVLMAVCLLAAALVVVSTGVRRLMLSLLLFLHFAGISTACLSAHPSPWAIQQIWVRVFRPYLEFMYLNNAYHFYAPEPGPSSYVWFRLIYTSPDGQDFGTWQKIPRIDEKTGRVLHPVALEYQRHLSLTNSIEGNEASPPPVITNAKGILEGHPRFVNRLRLMPGPQMVVGVPEPDAKHLRVPLHPGIPQLQQLTIPNESAKRLFSSYARFVSRKFAQHDENPTWRLKSVKIYRVIHWIIASPQLNNGISPIDPELYRAHYMGNYLPDGSETDLDDPYLYWLLPALRDNPNDPDSGITDFARKHAGDPRWYRPHGMTDWINPGLDEKKN